MDFLEFQFPAGEGAENGASASGPQTEREDSRIAACDAHGLKDPLLPLVEVNRVLLAAFPAARADRELRAARRTDGGLVPQGCARIFAVLAQGVEVQVDGLQALQVVVEIPGHTFEDRKTLL